MIKNIESGMNIISYHRKCVEFKTTIGKGMEGDADVPPSVLPG